MRESRRNEVLGLLALVVLTGGALAAGAPAARAAPTMCVNGNTSASCCSHGWLPSIENQTVLDALGGVYPQFIDGVDVLHTIRGMGYCVTEPDNAA